MAVGVAAHAGADARPPGRLRERGERRPALEARSLGVDEDRVEVVEVPERVVAPSVGLLPEREELRPLDGLLPGLDAEADRRGGHAASYTESTRGGKRWSMRCVRLLVGLLLPALSAAGARAAELRLERGDRMLVLAPHPDDEALACGGLIQRARTMRLPVRVLCLTYRALYLFTRVALRNLEGELAPALFPYLVHYRGWPAPRGLRAAEALTPPLLAPPATWSSLEVPPSARARKRAALQAHATQYRYSADYLLSFVRANELFGDFPVLAPGAPPEPAGTVRSDPPEELTPADRAAFVGGEGRGGRRAGARLGVVA